MSTPKVLFVDDEKPVLDACRRALRKKISIDTALGPAKALEHIDDCADYAVIVSDMRMPEMTGVELLAEVKRRSPNTVRMMLTGNSDQQTAIDAVNEGDIFRFLNKPCPPDKLWNSVEAAMEQHRLLVAERDLLENTLQGTIQVLADVLALVNPGAFGRTTRIRTHVAAIATKLGLAELWRYETMATLSQIGCVTVPDAVLEKVSLGHQLAEYEQALFDQHPVVAGDLIARIPRLGEVADAIRLQDAGFDNSPDAPIGSRILKVVLDFERIESRGVASSEAFDELKLRSNRYDPQVLEALEAVLGTESEMEAREVEVGKLLDDMMLAVDVNSLQGALVLCKGQQTTESVRARLVNFARNGVIAGKVMVWVPAGTG
ncbi:MAG: response regulator [Gammaproteobacteria bacterium]|nr:response regulator [Gammaproteobacteria bacterium]NNF61183.1 response regulator [Gammaproteobacteria bacterium]NNM19878.1 response regulator [Gammaproteobacteria bacterium]